jgi:5-methylthioadenosine/S-adenosylhomocysteine deaminase
MKTHKIEANVILSGATVVTANEAWDVFNPGAVVIQDDVLLAIGPADEIAKTYTAAETVNCRGKAIIPGLVNAHTHAPMTLLRGLADDLRLDVWLMGYMMPVEREFVSPEFCRLGTQLACVEMIRSGVTCFADMYYYEDSVARATAEAGLRAICGQTVLKFPAPDAGNYEEGLATVRQFIQSWQEHPLIVPAVAPHAPYSSTADIVHACADLATEYDVPLQIHLAETQAEVESIHRKYGTRVIPWVERQSLFKAKVLATHCVHVVEDEIRTLQHYQAGVAHCPTSNLKLASGVAPIAKMLELGVNVGIGTDGAASNNDLDMFEETRLAALLAKGIGGDPAAVPARQAFGMATIFGARALHLGQLTGSLEPGKRADLALVDLEPVHNAPTFRHDPNAIYARLVYAAKATDVTDVMVNGKWLMRDRRLLTLDEADLKEQAREIARQIDAFLIAREQSVLRKLVAIGGVEHQESFEVQAKAPVSDPQRIKAALQSGQIAITSRDHYHEHDIYFSFAGPEENRIRIRETGIVSDDGEVNEANYQLTLIGPANEHSRGQVTVLYRSRLAAPSPYTLRFYREYFKPVEEREIEKERWRWQIVFRDVEFQFNLDRLVVPDLGYFVEAKHSTWSEREAETTAALIGELLQHLGIPADSTIGKEYVDHAPLKSRD